MTEKNSKDQPSEGVERVHYRYADGSANVYRITGPEPYRFKYIPVKPEQSSSGTYDGGEPVDREIDEEVFSRVAELIDGAMSRASDDQKRLMGSGMISSNKGGVSLRANLARRSKDNIAIESYLESLRE